MTPDVRAHMTPSVQAEIGRIVGAPSDRFVARGGFESFVYEWARPDGTVFVKATWSERRTQAQIRAEMEFVERLAAAGVAVAPPVALPDGPVMRVAVDQGAFLLSATRAAPGQPVAKEALTAGHFEQLGGLAAQMHQVSRQQEVVALVEARPSWEAEHAALLPYATDSCIRERFEHLLAWLAELPRSPDVYGLIHTDAHLRNLHWQGTHPTVFDFDDCLGFWFASDLAIMLYYTLCAAPGSPEQQEEFERNLAALQRGYERVRPLPSGAWSSVLRFMDLREVVLYLVAERSIPAEIRTADYARMVEGRRARLVSGARARDLQPPAWFTE